MGRGGGQLRAHLYGSKRHALPPHRRGVPAGADIPLGVVTHLDTEVELGRKRPGIWLSGAHPRASTDIRAGQGEGHEAPSRVQPWNLKPVSPPVSFPICKMG